MTVEMMVHDRLAAALKSGYDMDWKDVASFRHNAILDICREYDIVPPADMPDADSCPRAWGRWWETSGFRKNNL